MYISTFLSTYSCACMYHMALKHPVACGLEFHLGHHTLLFSSLKTRILQCPFESLKVTPRWHNSPTKCNFTSKSLFQFQIFPSNPVLLCRILSREVQFSSLSLRIWLTLCCFPSFPGHHGTVTFSCGHWRIDAFEPWCRKRLLRVPWTARRSDHSILKEISPEYSWEGLMLKLKLQYFGHLMHRTDSLEKTLMLGKTEGRRRRGRQEDETAGWHHWLNEHEFEQAPGVGDGQGSLACFSLWGRKESDTT